MRPGDIGLAIGLLGSQERDQAVADTAVAAAVVAQVHDQLLARRVGENRHGIVDVVDEIALERLVVEVPDRFGQAFEFIGTDHPDGQVGLGGQRFNPRSREGRVAAVRQAEREGVRLLGILGLEGLQLLVVEVGSLAVLDVLAADADHGRTAGDAELFERRPGIDVGDADGKVVVVIRRLGQADAPGAFLLAGFGGQVVCRSRHPAPAVLGIQHFVEELFDRIGRGIHHRIALHDLLVPIVIDIHVFGTQIAVRFGVGILEHDRGRLLAGGRREHGENRQGAIYEFLDHFIVHRPAGPGSRL